MPGVSNDIKLTSKAQELLANPAMLVASLISGDYRGLRIIVDVEPLFMLGTAAPADVAPPKPVPSPAAQLKVVPVEGAATGIPDLSKLTWETLPKNSLSYRWPKKASDPDSTERYEEAYRSEVHLRGTHRVVVVGFTNRPSAGKDDRRRGIVFFGEPSALHPVVEASGANDFETSGKLASAIKLPDGKFLKPGAPMPAEYAELPTDLYTSIVRGPNAVNSIAVVANAHDRDEMLRILTHHALIRAIWRGWM